MTHIPTGASLITYNKYLSDTPIMVRPDRVLVALYCRQDVPDSMQPWRLVA